MAAYKHGVLEEKRVEAGDGGLCDDAVTQHSGYYKVNSPGKFATAKRAD